MVCAAQDRFDEKWISNVNVHQSSVNDRIQDLLSRHAVHDKIYRAAWLLKGISVIDLTTLAGDDTKSNVQRLCYKAANPLPKDFYTKLGFPSDEYSTPAVRTAAVCVYPNRVADAAQAIRRMKLEGVINIAAVATGFPTGSYPLETRLEEIRFAVRSGATEIDVVIDRSLVLSGQWAVLFDEIRQMRDACGEAHLKVILAVGELGTLTNVYKASLVAMSAGADFIKTSTGKESVNATLPVGLVMCRAIRHYYQLTGVKVGLKPAGGIRTVQDTINWLILVREELGPEWLEPRLFRIGASGLLGVIERWMHQLLTQEQPKGNRFGFI